MISVLLIWTFMAVTVFIAGTAVISLMGKDVPHHTDEIIMAGIVAVTVYAQIWSLFAGVSYNAVTVLCFICVVISVCCRDVLKQSFWKIRDGMTWRKAVWYLILILLFAFGTSHGYMHYDSDLYHAQAIHWIESFGIVPGLGNLHSRLAYNSSSFALTALYSFAFVNGQSYHVCAGFISLILAKVCFENARPMAGWNRLKVSDFVRVAALVYVFGIFGEMVSPESDYFALITLLYIFIRWIDRLEAEGIKAETKGIASEDIKADGRTADAGSSSAEVFAGLSMLAVWAVTVKLSVAVILLFAIYPIVLFIKEKRAGKIIRYLVCAAVIALPYLIRNIMISGWLLYPSTAIDICSADWKIPKGAAAYDAREIMIYGRGYTDAASASGIKTWEWLPHWFESLGMTDRILVTASIVSVIILLVQTVAALKRWTDSNAALKHEADSMSVMECRNGSESDVKPRHDKTPGMLFISWMAAGSFLFWLLTSPLIRYGRVLILLLPSLIFGQIIKGIVMKQKNEWKVRWSRIILTCFALLISYKTCILIRDNFSKNASASIIDQQDYGTYDTEPYKIGSVTVYRPTDGDRTGYYDFPSAPYSPEIEMRGSSVRDGFRVQ